MANYNCSDSSINSYGAGAYSTCTGSTQSVGAPDTGVFQQIVSSGSFTIIAPLAVAILITAVVTVVMTFRKRKAAHKS